MTMHNRLSAGIRPHTFISDNYAFVAPAVGSFELKKKLDESGFLLDQEQQVNAKPWDTMQQD